MAKSNGQDDRPTSAERGAATRTAVLRAAAELIGEVGWGRVSTRAIAERASVPHGAVSYHFRGKDELLREAAITGLEQAFQAPIAMTKSSGSVQDLVAGTLSWSRANGVTEPMVAVLVETVREAARDEWLRVRIADLLRGYRSALAELIGQDQLASRFRSGPSRNGLAVVVAALLDGLMFHALLDPELALDDAGKAIRTLLGDKGQQDRKGSP